MEYRFATIGEVDDIASFHPELAADNFDLCQPPFLRNPVSTDSAFPFLFYAIEDGKVLGSRKAISDRAVVNGKEYPWAWCFDTIVDSSQQGRGIGSGLVKLQSEEFDRLGVISSAAFSAPAMMRIYRKFGYRVLEPAPRMTLVRNAAPFVAKKIENRLIRSLASWIGTTVLNLESAIRGANRSVAPFTIAPITELEFSRHFLRADWAEQPNRWANSADWIVSRIQTGDELMKVTRCGSSNPSAIFVLRERTPDAVGLAASQRFSLVHFEILEDWACTADLLAAAVSRQMFARRCDVADIITSSPSLLAALRKRGYRKRGTGMTFVYKAPSAIEFDGSDDIADWHLTHFCSDGFRFA